MEPGFKTGEVHTYCMFIRHRRTQSQTGTPSYLWGGTEQTLSPGKASQPWWPWLCHPLCWYGQMCSWSRFAHNPWKQKTVTMSISWHQTFSYEIEEYIVWPLGHELLRTPCLYSDLCMYVHGTQYWEATFVMLLPWNGWKSKDREGEFCIFFF